MFFAYIDLIKLNVFASFLAGLPFKMISIDLN